MHLTTLLCLQSLEILMQNQKIDIPEIELPHVGNTIETITSHFGWHQLIHDPTQILGKSSTCIDLIFTSQPNMVVNSGVHSSLHANCHHQSIFAKSDKLYMLFPPSKKAINKFSKTTARSRYFLCVVKYLRN